MINALYYYMNNIYCFVSSPSTKTFTIIVHTGYISDLHNICNHDILLVLEHSDRSWVKHYTVLIHSAVWMSMRLLWWVDICF